jgi:hypothetical protein
MDAKVDDWVVTPRRGKAVEINALWYNALRLLAGWLQRFEEHGADAKPAAGTPGAALRIVQPPLLVRAGRLPLRRGGRRARRRRRGPAEPALRDLAAHPVLERRWEPVVRCARERLLTPVGMRSLARAPDYRPYYGDLRARDAAYHQGTVWGWLIGPFIDAWLRVHPDDDAGARRFLAGLIEHMDEAASGRSARSSTRRSRSRRRLHRAGVERGRGAARLGEDTRPCGKRIRAPRSGQRRQERRYGQSSAATCRFRRLMRSLVRRSCC